MKAKKKISSGANKDNKSVAKKNMVKKSAKKKTVGAEIPVEKSVSKEQDENAVKKTAKKKASRSGVRKRAKILSAETIQQDIPSQPKKTESGFTSNQTAQSPQTPSTKPAEKTAETAVSKTEEKLVKDVIPELEGVEIPPILFEDDSPESREPDWISKKYALGPGAVKNHFTPDEESFELPEAYGTGEIIVTPRDPYWIYAAWDLTLKQIKHYNSLSAHGNMVLRVYVNNTEGAPKKEIHVYPHSRDWFIKVDEPGLTYVIVLGYYDKNGGFVNVAVSSPVKTPQPVSLRVPVQAVPAGEKQEHRGFPARSEQPLIVEQQPPAAQFAIPEKPSVPIKPETRQTESFVLPTPEEQAILTAMSLPFTQKGSVELAKPVEKVSRVEQQPEIQVIRLPSSLEFGISSPSKAKQPEERKFWFNIQAEIIIYGATEPDATVEIAGEKIKLRPDGTFTLRFALPDGFYKLLASATSRDGQDTRLVNLEFARKTACVLGKTGECPHQSPPMPQKQGGK